MPVGAIGVWYRIDANDQIVFVDDAWERIAGAVSIPDGGPGAVTGRPLWEFIGDRITRRIYEQVLVRVRAGRVAQFTLRCDSASYRRLMRMTVAADSTGFVDFRTEPVEVEKRDPVALLSLEATRSGEFLRACGWCNRIDIGDAEWTEVEEAVERLRLFEQAAIPRLSHGICDACEAKLVGTIEAMERDR